MIWWACAVPLAVVFFGLRLRSVPADLAARENTKLPGRTYLHTSRPPCQLVPRLTLCVCYTYIGRRREVALPLTLSMGLPAA